MVNSQTKNTNDFYRDLENKSFSLYHDRIQMCLRKVKLVWLLV